MRTLGQGLIGLGTVVLQQVEQAAIDGVQENGGFGHAILFQ